MTFSPHTLKKLILELNFDGLSQSETLQKSDEFKELFVEYMLPKLEHVFNRFEQANAIIQIDRLDISLDDVNIHEATMDTTLNALAEAFERELVRALNELAIPSSESLNPIGTTAHIRNDHFSIVRKAEQQADLFFFYLKNGYLPWNSNPDNFSDPDKILSELLLNTPDHLIQEFIALRTSQHAIKRFVLQFREVLIKQLLAMISKDILSEFEILTTQSKLKTVETTSRSTSSILLEASLNYALDSAHITESRETISRHILKEAAKIVGTDLPHLQQALDIEFTAELTNNNGEKKLKKEADLLETEGVHISNAGLILTWPYLHLFFKELKVHTESGLDKEKALYLLHYLCFGSEKNWEFSLFLNKIICGWDLELPLGKKIKLSKTEKEECDQLVEAIVRNWSALKNTSVEGFREAFLQRNGIISKVNENWLLRIERKGYDVMLDQLDWGINTIKLSWNEYTIFVEW